VEVETIARLSWSAMIPLIVLVVGATLVAFIRAAQLRRARSPTGIEGLSEEIGSTLETVDTRGGTVLFHGERWNAVSDEPLAEQTPVRVVDARGLTLRVARVNHAKGTAA
jgi:membrane-bound serine protease (ClpP class)